MKPTTIPNPRDVLALFTTGIIYWLTIAPTARSELRRWRRCAQSIPNPVLRGHALEKLSSEALNPEAAAFFAVLAPRSSRLMLIRLIVAYQVMYDYLDAVNEASTLSPLQDGLQLHRALLDTVKPQRISTEYYEHHPWSDDGGYLNALIGECRGVLATLPSKAVLTKTLIAAAKRCGEAQAHNHAVSTNGNDQLIHWAEGQASYGYLWWEIAAAGISCLAIHALFAVAATPKTTPREAERVDTAYFPSVCAISAMLDSLIDLPRDAGTTNHSFARHYDSNDHAAGRYAAVIADADKRLAGLRHARRHRTILKGITAYYLSAPEARNEFAHTVTSQAIKAANPVIWPILVVMRVRRLKHAARYERSPSIAT